MTAMRRSAAALLGFALGLGTLLLTSAATAAESSRVHALLVIDTATGLSGLNSDMANAQRLLGAGVLPPDRVSLTVFTGAQVTHDGILNYYRNADVQPEDTLFFYYSGHGATDPRRGHLLDLKSEPVLFRDELRTAMMGRNPRLIVILTDSCSNRKLIDPNTGSGKGLGAEEKHVRPGLMRQLLLENRGLVDINASTFAPAQRIEQVAWGDPKLGGLFTRAFLDLAADPKTPDNESWPELIERLKIHSQHWYESYKKHNLEERAAVDPVEAVMLRKQSSQTPQVMTAGPVDEVVLSTALPEGKGSGRGRLGLTVGQTGNGLVIENVADGSPAKVRGFEPGDRVLEVDGRPVKTPEEFQQAIGRVPGGGTTRLLIVNKNNQSRLLVAVRLGNEG